MKLSKTGIKELTARYRLILLKGFAILATIGVTSGAMATETVTTDASGAGTFATTSGTVTLVTESDLSTATVAAATKATQDGSGNVISSTYATKNALQTLGDRVNEKQDALSTDQLAAVNSGITSDKVSTYDGYAATIATKANASDVGTLTDLTTDTQTSIVAAINEVDSHVDDIVDGTTVVAKATADKNGNDITTTYAKVADTKVADGTYNYISQGTGVASNLTALDTQAKVNADAITDIQNGYAFTGDISATNISTAGTVSAGTSTLAQGALTVDTDNKLTSDGLTTEKATVNGALDATGMASLDGGINVNDKFSVDKDNGNTVIDGKLDVSGKTTLTTLSTSGEADLNSLKVTNNAAISGNETVGGTLSVTGNGTFGGTLGVTGNTTLSTVSTSGKATLNSAEVTNDLAVKGNETVAGTLGVTGNTTLTTVSTSGKATLNSAEVTNDLAVKGNETVTGTLGVTGNTTLTTVSTSGKATLNSAEVTNDLAVKGNETVAGTLGVTGETTLGDKLTVTGATQLNDTLTVADDKATTLGGTLEVKKAATLDDKLTVTGATQLNDTLTVAAGKATTLGGTLGVSGETTLGDKLTVTGATQLNDTLTVADDKATTLGGTLEVKKAATLDDKLTVTGATQLNDTLTVAAGKATTLGGTLGVSGETTLGDKLTVTGATQLNDTLTVAAGKATTLGGTLGVSGKTTLSADNGLAFGDGATVKAINTGATYAAATDASTLATMASLKAQAENATFTPAGTAKNVASATTLNGAITALDTAIGDRTISSANTAVNTALATDVATAIKTVGDEIGTQTYVNDKTVNYAAITADTDLTNALSQVASNVGKATDLGAALNEVSSEKTVNANIAAVNATIGDMDNLQTKVADTTSDEFVRGNLTNGATEALSGLTVADAISNIDKTMGQIHGLQSKLAPSGAGTNLASGTTVEEHLTALDAAIGDRNIDSANTAINTGVATSVAQGFVATGNAIGDQQYSHHRYVSRGSSLTSAVSALDAGLSNLEDRVDAMDERIDKYHDETKAGFASVAALTALVPNARSKGNTQISVGTGYHRGETGFAIGGFHYLNDNVLFNLGAAYAGDASATFRGGVTFGF